MAVVDVDPENKLECFFCFEVITRGQFVYWAGNLPQWLVLHPRCALDLALRLCGDVRQHNKEHNLEVVFMENDSGESRGMTDHGAAQEKYAHDHFYQQEEPRYD